MAKTVKKAAKKAAAKTAKKSAPKPAAKSASKAAAKAPKKAVKSAVKTVKKAAPKAAKKAAPKKAVAKKAVAKKAAPKKAASKAPKPGLMAPQNVSAVLGAVIGNKALPRTQITKKIWDYIKANKLQDKTNKRMINADAKLLEFFGGQKQISMFDLPKFISNHVSNA